MPKASKKRKDKAADFAKAKLKLGKGKQLPSNAIDTSFKAKCALCACACCESPG
jgi:pre-rRNA-processing protein IPI1